MTEKIAFEVGNPTSEMKENLREKNWNENWTPCMFLTHVYNYHDNNRKYHLILSLSKYILRAGSRQGN